MTTRRADPALALVTKRFRLWDTCEASYDEKDEENYCRRRDRTIRAVAKLDQRIVSMIATSAEGLIAQVRLATGSPDTWHCIDDDEIRVKLSETIIAGIRALIGEATAGTAAKRDIAAAAPVED